MRHFEGRLNKTEETLEVIELACSNSTLGRCEQEQAHDATFLATCNVTLLLRDVDK